MSTPDQLRKAVHAALEQESAIQFHQSSIRIDVHDAVVVLDGQVLSIIGKRLALHLAATVAGVAGVQDRLRVTPVEHRGDGAIRDSVYRAISEESVFRNYAVRAIDGPHGHQASPEGRSGRVEIAVAEGVVTLTGEVQSLSHRRLADVLAWWAPGAVDVSNRLRVVPPEEDSDDEILDALRMVLEKDPWLDASQIHASARDRVVTLEGLARSAEQKRMAENDAWYILGVHRVVNRITVRP